MYLLLYCTPRNYGKESNEVRVSKGKKGAPKSRGTSRNHSVLMGSHWTPRRHRYQQTTTSDITSILGATGSQGLREGQSKSYQKGHTDFLWVTSWIWGGRGPSKACLDFSGHAQ